MTFCFLKNQLIVTSASVVFVSILFKAKHGNNEIKGSKYCGQTCKHAVLLIILEVRIKVPQASLSERGHQLIRLWLRVTKVYVTTFHSWTLLPACAHLFRSSFEANFHPQVKSWSLTWKQRRIGGWRDAWVSENEVQQNGKPFYKELTCITSYLSDGYVLQTFRIGCGQEMFSRVGKFCYQETCSNRRNFGATDGTNPFCPWWTAAQVIVEIFSDPCTVWRICPARCGGFCLSSWKVEWCFSDVGS